MWLSTASIVFAQTLPQTSMEWNDARYKCVRAVLGQPNPNIPNWEQRIPIYLSLRSVGGVGQATYTCSYEDAPATAPDAASGQPLAESLVWDGQQYTCIWTGQVVQDAADPSALGPVNVTIRRADGLALDGRHGGAESKAVPDGCDG
jgi:hypothetical protein